MLVAALTTACAAATNPYVRSFDANGQLRFDLAEPTGHPHFKWPRTLLNYHIQLHGPEVDPTKLRLVDSSGDPVPFQVSNLVQSGGAPQSMTLSFFSDLPSGATRSFLLIGTEGPTPEFPAAVSVTDEEGSVVIDTGSLRVRLPGAGLQSHKSVPGPVMQVDHGRGWIGTSRLITPNAKVTALDVVPLANGPLFAEYQLRYRFDTGAFYEARIKAVAGYDFIEFTERAGGFAERDGAAFEIEWNGFSPDMRRGDERVDQPRVIHFRGEDPAFTGPPRIENPAEDFYYWLGPHAADGDVCARHSSFTDSSKRESLHIAIMDSLAWEDGVYPLWTASQKLGIRFRQTGEKLVWKFPLVQGSRKTALSFTCDEAAAKRSGGYRLPHDRFIESRYGCMGLDRIKDWQLAYAGKYPRNQALFGDWKGRAREHVSAGDYMKSIDNCEIQKVEGGWAHPVGLRIMGYWVVPGFDKWREKLSPEELRRATAYLLFTAYIAAREECSPVRNGLGGHPNFMADWKYPLLAAAYLFPEHPMAAEWAAQFEKSTELLALFHTRPPVGAWDARGGRWTESIGIYNWAFLEPTCQANRMGIAYDGRNRMLSQAMAMHGDYLAGIVTAPVKLSAPGPWPDGTELTSEHGFQRIHPPQGAHAGRRAIPSAMAELGEWMRHYRPITAESMAWAAQRPGDPQEGGTNPRPKSAKFTGYGFVLRAGVGTADEVSVFLQQIDQGPNYRWGFGNEGGCGEIYYYARGSSFAGHLGEDAGDRRVNDAEFTCNTGTYRDQTFRAVGMNDLTGPLHDLGHAQHAMIFARRGPDAYSWPEYESRDVILAGGDYLVIFDQLNTPSRASWSIEEGRDLMPTIIPVRGEFAYKVESRVEAKSTGITTRWDPYKGAGDRMMIVSHRKDLKLASRATDTQPYDRVTLPGCEDLVFRNRTEIRHDSPELRFTGTAGLVRRHGDGRRELALFHGSRIGADGVTLETDSDGMAAGLLFNKETGMTGTISGRGGKLRLTIDAALPASFKPFLDGAEARFTRQGNRLEVMVPAGHHRIEFTGGAAQPLPPEILRTVHQPGAVLVEFESVASAGRYRVERSRDGGRTWVAAGETKASPIHLRDMGAGRHHVRMIALNGPRESQPGHEYPVVITAAPPLPPEGLRLRLAENQVAVQWGEVLGAREYVLFRRPRGKDAWREIFRGSTREFTDRVEGVSPPNKYPGLEFAAQHGASSAAIYEYAVAAADGHGEGPKSLPVDSDPASWLNWYPSTPLKFKRRSGYHVPPFLPDGASPPEFYPE